MRPCEPFQIELRIPRKCDFVRVARQAAVAIGSLCQFTTDRLYDMKLAVSEACTNCIEHVSDESCNDVLIRWACNGEDLAIEVVDRGPGFDPSAVGQIDTPDDVPGGLGLLVMRAIADGMDVRCDPGVGTCVRMVWRCKGQ